MYIIDRIEDGYAVISSEKGNVCLSLSKLPSGASEGDVLTESEGRFIVDYEKTAARRKHIIELSEKVFGE